jgi:putative transposase
MDEPHLLAAARYIALNPVVAGLVSRAEDWPWSSTRAQLAGEDDELAGGAVARTDPRFCRTSRHADRRGDDDPDRAGPTIGRPLGRPEWIAMLEPARPPFSAPQTRPKAARGARHRTTRAAAVKHSANA